MVADELWTIGFLYTITTLFCLPEGIISQKLDFQDEETCKGFEQSLANNSHVILPVQLSDQDKPCGVSFPRMEFDELLDCICNNNNNNNNEPSKECVVSWNENGVGNVSFISTPLFFQRCENNIFVPLGGLVVACSNSSVISSSTIDRCENVPIPRSDWACSSLPRTLHLGGDWILQAQQSGNGAEVTVCSYSRSITPITPATALTTTTKTAAALTTTITTTTAPTTTTTTTTFLTIAPIIKTSLTSTTTISPTPYSSTSVKNGNSSTNGLTSNSNTPGSTDSSESDIRDDKLKIIIISIVTSIIALTAIILTVIFIIRKGNKQQNMSSKDVEHNRDTKSSAQPESVGLNGTTNMAYEDPCDSEEPYGPVHLSSPNIDNNPNFDSSNSPYCNNPVDISNPNLDQSPDFDSTSSASYCNGTVYPPHLDSTFASYYNGPVHLPNLDHNPDFDGTSASYYNGPVHLPNLDHNPDFDGTSTFYYNTLT